LPLEARLLASGQVLVATAATDNEKAAALRERGAQIVCLANGEGRVDLSALLQELARRGINEVHVEGGARLNGALLAAGLVDEILLYLAPCLLGNSARGLFDLPVLESLDGKQRLALRELRMLGADLRVVARLMTNE